MDREFTGGEFDDAAVDVLVGGGEAQRALEEGPEGGERGAALGDGAGGVEAKEEVFGDEGAEGDGVGEGERAAPAGGGGGSKVDSRGQRGGVHKQGSTRRPAESA